MLRKDYARKDIVRLLGIIFILLLIIFSSLNVGVGKPEIIEGTVIAVGIDSTSKFELPKPIISVQLKDGTKISIEGVREVNIKVGDTIKISRRKRFLTPGFEYQFKSVERKMKSNNQINQDAQLKAEL